jgi:hypothetical protein
MNTHRQRETMLKLIAHHQAYESGALVLPHKVSFVLGDDYTDLLMRLCILADGSKTSVIKTAIDELAELYGGGDILYPTADIISLTNDEQAEPTDRG